MLYSDLVSLTEGVRAEKVFHLTKNWYQIIRTGHMIPSVLSGAESRITAEGLGYPRDHPEHFDAAAKLRKDGYKYISFARSLHTEFLSQLLMELGQADVVVAFEFDLRGMKRDYKIVPVDYYKDRKDVNEEEERLITTDREFPLWNFVTGIHAYVNPHWEGVINDMHKSGNVDSPEGEEDAKQADRKDRALMRQINQLMWTAQTHKIPAYIYRDIKQFKATRWAEADEIAFDSDMDYDDD